MGGKTLSERGRRQLLKMFDEYVIKAVDSGLLIIGETGKEFVYHSIESRVNLRLTDVPKQIEVFHKALVDMFGEGARIIEKLIAMKLYDALNLEFRDHRGWTLVEYVANARKSIEPSRG